MLNNSTFSARAWLSMRLVGGGEAYPQRCYLSGQGDGDAISRAHKNPRLFRIHRSIPLLFWRRRPAFAHVCRTSWRFRILHSNFHLRSIWRWLPALLHHFLLHIHHIRHKSTTCPWCVYIFHRVNIVSTMRVLFLRSLLNHTEGDDDGRMPHSCSCIARILLWIKMLAIRRFFQ